ncbi:MAG TPA: phage tail tube protein [Clostridiales bacterium]|nr:phage tail tube protein [Clostridiales bacterium]
MANNYTRLSDTITAQEGTAIITIDGQNRELFEISSLRAQLDMVVQERRMLGHRMTQHKVTGVTGTGSATLYFMNSEQLNLAIDFIKNGTRSNIKLKVKNNDPQSTVGVQEVVLSNVIFNTIPVTALEESEDPITFDSDFTFDDITNLKSFDLPDNYK